MGADELLDEESFDPKKLFDSSQYNTLIVNREGFTKKQNETADDIERLLESDINRQEQEDIFVRLKENKALHILVQAISSAKDTDSKVKLIAAVWESGMDAADEFLFFVRLACSNDFLIAHEALTVIENTESKIDIPKLESAMQIALSSKGANTDLQKSLMDSIKSIAKNSES